MTGKQELEFRAVPNFQTMILFYLLTEQNMLQMCSLKREYGEIVRGKYRW